MSLISNIFIVEGEYCVPVTYSIKFLLLISASSLGSKIYSNSVPNAG